ncbi:hypothetical protein HMPREF9005_2039 [Actinomyces sp. oral taxon 178 str. F0338]|nr:hypothetical protein HMPREF9005_2039 [Actinomyces sp. oral taxon 178 str. F0338]
MYWARTAPTAPPTGAGPLVGAGRSLGGSASAVASQACCGVILPGRRHCAASAPVDWTADTDERSVEPCA